jgi:hypothetical protein
MNPVRTLLRDRLIKLRKRIFHTKLNPFMRARVYSHVKA